MRDLGLGDRPSSPCVNGDHSGSVPAQSNELDLEDRGAQADMNHGTNVARFQSPFLESSGLSGRQIFWQKFGHGT